MKEIRYTASMTFVLLEEILRAYFKAAISDLPYDSVVVGVKEDKYCSYAFDVILSIPSMPYEIQEAEDLHELRVGFAEVVE
jgi:hypothetical protein